MAKPKNKLKMGYTTGTCAQAATKGSALMLAKGKIISTVEVLTPSKNKFNIKLIDQKIGKSFAKCGVIKDSGDDPDVTNGIKVYSKVKKTDVYGIKITGGTGVGKVTKQGLAVPFGEYAINPIPKIMIKKEIEQALNDCKGIEVTISVPQGKKIAKHTFNSNLGILGGISIIGTSGIVLPRSVEAYKASLTLQLDVIKASGEKKVVLILGYVGEKYCNEVLKIKSDSFIKIGDHVGFMIKECSNKNMKNIHLIGHLGKLIKVANGQFNTNIKHGDNRIESIAEYAKKEGAKDKIINEILDQKTAEAAIEIIKNNNLMNVFKNITMDVSKKLKDYVNNKINLICTILSLNGEELAVYIDKRTHNE